jgi:competence protein ComEC
MFLSVLSFVTGILVVQQFTELPGTIWIISLILMAIGGAYLRYWRLMFFVTGLLWAIFFATIRLTDRLPPDHQGQSIQVEGTVVGLPRHNQRRVKFDFAVSNPVENFPAKIKLSWYYPKQLIKAGQFWQFTVKLKQPHGRFNPDQFDYERWLFMQNIGATGYVKNKPEPKLIARKSLILSVDSLRQIIADKLTELVGDTRYMGVIKALTIGERSEISAKQWKIFRNTGTVHLLAISGLHIGLIAGFAYLLARKIAIKVALSSPQIIATVFSIFTAFLYSALAGFSLPTQRALLMLTVAMAAISWQRNITPVNTLSITMLVVLLFDPLAVLSAGFWLSYLAVVLIVYSLTGRLAKAGYWAGAVKIHWVTALGLSPLLLYYFQQVSIVAPVANLFTVPVISLLVVPLCLLAVFMMFFVPVIAEALFFLVNSILQVLWHVLSLLNEMTYATLSIASVSFYAVPLSLFGIAILLSPRGIPARWLGLVMLLPLFITDIKKPDQGDVTLTLLDVGQGLATVVETANHVLVFDTGAKYSRQSDMGNMVVVPFLNNKGIKRVDTLIISHGDNDHIGGAESVIAAQQVDKILTSAPKMLAEYNPVQCQVGQSWVWDEVEFDILSPQQNLYVSENNNSCVLKVSTKQGSILLTGDIEQIAEHGLIKNYPQQINSDVLVAPHHGSKTSSTLNFLKHVKPRYVLIPSGFRNRFSFPHKEVLKRYQQINAKVFNVAEEGALIVKVENNTYTLHSTRKDQGKYWN